MGCRSGSFDAELTAARVARVDLTPWPGVVCANAGRLPFADGSMDLVVANHSLEHFVDLDGAVREMGRVVKRSGSVFVSVPDANTWTDRVYGWQADGGGHVNAFTDAAALGSYLAERTGLPLRAAVTLHSGYSYLHRAHGGRRPRRIALAGGGCEWTLQAGCYLFRVLDRRLGTRLSVYGWAFYLGAAVAPEAPWRNVCVRCGAGHAGDWLRESGRAERWVLWRRYACVKCGTWNLFTEDR
ncbi:MAG TPA: class I SAM-dependent methyltransferase [Bryobacteraceae bacterium]|nr:class I SAM-dependent methyltransferase [Bryobacteraceae bacterium]